MQLGQGTECPLRKDWGTKWRNPHTRVLLHLRHQPVSQAGKKDGLKGTLPEKGGTANLVLLELPWKLRPQPGFKVLDQKGLVGTSDLTGCQYSNKIHAHLQDALQILSYLKNPYECWFFFLLSPSPHPNIKQGVTRCNRIITWKSKQRFPEIPLLPKRKKRRSWQYLHRVTETRGEKAALPKKSLFKGFQTFWEWCSIS